MVGRGNRDLISPQMIVSGKEESLKVSIGYRPIAYFVRIVSSGYAVGY